MNPNGMLSTAAEIAIAGRARPARTRHAIPVLVGCVIALQLANAFWLQTAWPRLTAIIAMDVGAFVVLAAPLWGFAPAEDDPE